MENARLLREEEHFKAREKRLMDTLLDGIISKDKFVETQTEINVRMSEVRKQINEIIGRDKLIKDSSDAYHCL